VQEFVGESMRSIAAEIISDVRNSFMANLESVTWMDAQTRMNTERKLQAITTKLIHPDKWTDYSSVNLERHSWTVC